MSTQGKIYLLQEDNKLQDLNPQPYLAEVQFQDLLEKYPVLLAGDQINDKEPRRWLLIAREIGIPDRSNGEDRWALDHLFLDQDGIPTLVEVKRSSDTRIRRAVVGQMLDYAANAILHWSLGTIFDRFVANCEAQEKDPARVVAEFIDCDARDLAKIKGFWNQVETNLQAGKIRLLFVADQIPTELRRIVEFLNAQMAPAEVLAVEIKQYASEGVRTLVPKVFGRTASADRKKVETEVQQGAWDKGSFLTALRHEFDPEVVRAAEKILDWAEKNVSRIEWGKGPQIGRFTPILKHKGKDHKPFIVWTTGSIEIYFQYFKNHPAFEPVEKRLELCKRLNAIPGVSLSQEDVDRQPYFSLTVLRMDQAVQQFIEAFDWFVQEVQRT
jgi:hypothetical protein